jgi:hypothetical protein
MSKFLKYLKSFFSLNRSNSTVRYMFPALLTFAALFSLASIVSTQSSYIRLESSNTSIEAGERFTLHIYASSHVPVNAVDITLAFDKSSVEVLEVDRGQSVLTIWTEDPIIKSNKVILRGGTFRKGFLGEHEIASIDLRAVSTGLGTFEAKDVMLLAGDGSGTPVKVSKSVDSSLSFFIYDENTDPETIAVNVKVKIVTDINGDGKVTLADISAFMAAWSSKAATYDFNSDGKMTFKDFSIILADFFIK